MAQNEIDIRENNILEMSSELLNTLLKDHTLSAEGKQVNIFWPTDNYAERAAGYQYSDPITIEAITGDNGDVIAPRALKAKTTQQQRSRERAEVFTPSWVCNKQNNLVDNEWFGREGVFNTEVVTQCEGCKTGNIRRHNGIYALIKDWNAPKAKRKIRFIDLMK